MEIPYPPAFPIYGKAREIPADSIAPPKVLNPTMTQIPAPQQTKYPIRKTGVKYWPKDIPTTIPGQNGVPLPKKIAAIPDTFPLPLPERTKALVPRSPSNKSRHFKLLDEERGLPYSSITKMIEDTVGHYWIGGNDGLIQYNGKDFLHYKLKEIFDFGTIKVHFQDAAGNIWFSIDKFAKLVKFDGEQLIVYELNKVFASLQEGEGSFSIYRHIYDVVKGRNNTLWFAFAGGLVRLEDDYVHLYDFIALARTNNLYMTPEGKLWLLNQDGIIGYSTASGIEEFRQYRYSIPEDWLHTFQSRKYMSGSLDANGRIWFQAGQNIYRFSQDSLEFFSSPILNSEPSIAFYRSANEQLWGIHGDSELIYFEPKKLEKGDTYITAYLEPTDLLHLVLLVDKQGRVWFNLIGKGIEYFSDKQIQINDFDSVFEGGGTTNIQEDPSGGIWFALHHYPHIAKLNGEFYSVFQTFTSDRPEMVVRDIHLEEKVGGALWMGTSMIGLMKWDGKQLLQYAPDEGLPVQQCFAITNDLEGNLWLGSLSEGLTRLKPEQLPNTVTNFALSSPNKFVQVNAIRAIITDQNGNVWIGVQGSGLWKFDGKYTTFYTEKEGLSHNEVVSLMEDRSGYIWAGTTRGGVNRIDVNQDPPLFTHYTTKDGLSDNDIWSITEDTVGNIWLGVSNCLNVLLRQELESKDSVVYQARNYCGLEGLTFGEFYANASMLDREGNLWLGNTNNTVVVQPGLYPIAEKPSVAVSEIGIAQTNIDFRALADSIASQKDWWIGENQKRNLSNISFDGIVPFHNYPKELKLPHYFNSLNFRFVPLHYPNLEQVQFSYFMEEIDNNWSQPSPENTAEYRSLAPGFYTFKVRAAGTDLKWGEPFVYTFTVRLPGGKPTGLMDFWR